MQEAEAPMPPRPQDADAAWRSYREPQAAEPIRPPDSADAARQPAVFRLQLHSSDSDGIATRTMMLQKEEQMQVPFHPEHPDQRAPMKDLPGNGGARAQRPHFAPVPGF